jgi:hypothetical protein
MAELQIRFDDDVDMHAFARDLPPRFLDSGAALDSE